MENTVDKKYLTFNVNQQYYAILINEVIEIIKPQTITELPGILQYVKGIIDLRGKFIPIIDMNLRFGNQAKKYTKQTCIIIVKKEEKYIGLIVDSVEEVCFIDDNVITKPPDFSENNASAYIDSIAKVNDNIIFLINLKILTSDIFI